MTMEQEWQRYKSRAYPAGLPPRQMEETRKAFMAGGGSMFITMMANAKLPGDHAFEAMKATETDIREELTKYATKPEARN